ncbi:hypothetical protein FOZ62_016139, partial [Perkinsus olseni]
MATQLPPLNAAGLPSGGAAGNFRAELGELSPKSPEGSNPEVATGGLRTHRRVRLSREPPYEDEAAGVVALRQQMAYIVERLEKQEDRLEAVGERMDAQNQIDGQLLRKLQRQISMINEQARTEFTTMARQLRGASRAQVDLRTRVAAIEAETEGMADHRMSLASMLADGLMTTVEEQGEALAELREQMSRLSVGLLGVGGKMDSIMERDGKGGDLSEGRTAKSSSLDAAAVTSLVSRQVAAVKEACSLEVARRYDDLLALLLSARTEMEGTVARARETTVAEATKGREEAVRLMHDDLVSLIRTLTSEQQRRSEAATTELRDTTTTQVAELRKSLATLEGRVESAGADSRVATRSATQASQQLETLSRVIAEVHGRSFNADQAKAMKGDILEKMATFEVTMLESLRGTRKEVSAAQQALSDALAKEASQRAEECHSLAASFRDAIKGVAASQVTSTREIQKQVESMKRKMQRRSADDAERADRLSRYVDDKLGSLTSTVASNHDECCDRIQDLGERLGDISIAGKENLEQLERRLREEVEATSAAVTKSVGQTRELLASEVSRLEGMVAGLAARLDAGGDDDNKRFTDWQRQWEGRVSEVSDACRRLRDSIVEQRGALDAKIREETRKVEAQCKRAIDRAAEENRQHVANEGAQREENLHRRIAGLVEEEEEKRRAMNGHLEAMEGRLDDKLAQASQGVARHLNDIRLAVNKMAKVSQECVDQQVSQLLKASEGRIIASCEHLMEVEKMRVDELVEGQSEKSEKRWAKKEEERWKMMCKIVQDVDDKLTLTRVHLQEDIQLASESLSGEVEAIDKALRSVEDLVKSGNRTLQESIDRAVKALHSADAHQKRRLEATKEAIVERTRVMDEATRMLIDEVSMRLESQKDE